MTDFFEIIGSSLLLSSKVDKTRSHEFDLLNSDRHIILVSRGAKTKKSTLENRERILNQNIVAVGSLHLPIPLTCYFKQHTWSDT
jgi:hypothetical protein